MHNIVGEGGMGAVWRGIHTPTQAEVAVKVLHPSRGRSAKENASFRNEVWAMARLNHPGIVNVLDFGQIDEEVERATDGQFVAGSHYLVMEFVNGGTLGDVIGPVSLKRLVPVLLDLLAALAHAHARGVIHRDLKPANILTAQQDGVDSFKLTDFGIAYALGPVEVLDVVPRRSGTYRYMAPEQILGHWRDQGAWTDLYALGCVAHQLISGDAPFGRATGEDLLRCHLHAPVPRLSGQLRLPSEVQTWLDHLLAKYPRDRFESAADAAWALRSIAEKLGEVDEPAGTSLFHNSSDLDFEELAKEETLDRDSTTRTMGSGFADSQGPRDETRTDGFVLEPVLSTLNLLPMSPPFETARIPTDWRREETGSSQRLVGAGLRLYDLRTIPFVNRDDERDVLWDLLLEVRTTGRAKAILLRGATGTGKSRLVEWMSQRCAEVAGIPTLKATHSPIEGPGDGLTAAIMNVLRCATLNREDVIKRAEWFIRQFGITGDVEQTTMALAELIIPSTDLEQQGSATDRGKTRTSKRVRLSTPEERYSVIISVLRGFCGLRPALFWLDDAHWGSDAIGLTKFVLESQARQPLPVLFLLTVRDEALSERPLEAAQLNELLASGVSSLNLKPLSPSAHGELIEHLLGLETDLSKEVSRRTAGNPLFAVQLVGDWVHRGVLESGPTGLRLRSGASAHVPDDIHQLWCGRLAQMAENVSATNPDDCLKALEVAAALGREIDAGEWEQACQNLKLHVPSGLLETLITHGLAHSNELGWSFRHAMICESIERTSREAARWQSYHLACAEMLEGRYAPEHTNVKERIGQHLKEAGQLTQALKPLFEGAEARFRTSDFRQARALLELREEAMDAAHVNQTDLRRGEGWLLSARCFHARGATDDAETWVDKIEQHQNQPHWERLMAWAASLRGSIAIDRSDTNSSVAAFEKALALFDGIDDEEGLVDCLSGLGSVHMWRRELESALKYLEAALELQERLGRGRGLGHTLKGLANVYRCMGDYDHSKDVLTRARRVFEEIGSRADTAACLNDLGEMARFTGDLVSAEELYSQSLRLFESVGSVSASTPRLNLAYLFLTESQHDRAQKILSAERIALEKAQCHLDLLWVYAGLLPCAAARNDWVTWDECFEKIETLLSESGLVDEDIPWCAQLAGDLAVNVGETQRARAAYQLSQEQWEQTGKEDKAEVVAAILLSLE